MIALREFVVALRRRAAFRQIQVFGPVGLGERALTRDARNTFELVDDPVTARSRLHHPQHELRHPCRKGSTPLMIAAHAAEHVEVLRPKAMCPGRCKQLRTRELHNLLGDRFRQSFAKVVQHQAEVVQIGGRVPGLVRVFALEVACPGV